MPYLPTPAVVARADALDAGWSDSRLHRYVRGGRIGRLRRGFYAEADAVDEPIRQAMAAQRAVSRSVVSHRSAALLHGLPLLGNVPPFPDLTVPPRTTGDTAGAHLRRATLRPEDVCSIDGTPVTSVARTLIDMARWCSSETAIVALDHALHAGLVDEAALAEVAALCAGWPKARRITAALTSADGRSESPLESVSRLRFDQFDLPPARLQAVLRSPHGTFLGRADFYWDEYGVVGEADGRAKYTDRDVLFAEKRRQERLEVAGLVVVRWAWPDLADMPALARRIRAALERGRRLAQAALPASGRNRPSERKHAGQSLEPPAALPRQWSESAV